MSGLTGYIDVGGGMRAVYGAGVLDRCLDEGISFLYYLGVSAGSANITSFLAEQRGRCMRFYSEYAFRSEYMSLHNFAKNGSYIDLDYIYSTLSDDDGEDPLDFDRFINQNCRFEIIATDAVTGKPKYFNFKEIKRNDYFPLKASCCIPMVCRAYEKDGGIYYDGGLSDPVPIRRALGEGCDKVILVLTRPKSYTKRHRVKPAVFDRMLKAYPETAKLLVDSVDKYNDDIKYACELEKQGKVFIVAPDDCCGVDTLSRNRDALDKLYKKGYEDAVKIKSFLAADVTEK